jgi:hypothetical protein
MEYAEDLRDKCDPEVEGAECVACVACVWDEALHIPFWMLGCIFCFENEIVLSFRRACTLLYTLAVWLIVVKRVCVRRCELARREVRRNRKQPMR